MCTRVLLMPLLVVVLVLPFRRNTAAAGVLDRNVIVSNHLDLCLVSGLKYKCSFHTSNQVKQHDVKTLQHVVVPYNLTLDHGDYLSLESASSLTLFPTCISKVNIWTSQKVFLSDKGYSKLRDAGCNTSLEAWASHFDFIERGVDRLSLWDRCEVEVLNATDGFRTAGIYKSEVKSLTLRVPESGELAVHHSSIGELVEVKILGKLIMIGFRVQTITTKGIFMDTQERVTLENGTISEVRPEGVIVRKGKLRMRNVTLRNLEHNAFVVNGGLDFENCHFENVTLTSILLNKDNSTVTFRNVRIRSYFITELELRWNAELSSVYPVMMILGSTHQHHPDGISNDWMSVISDMAKLTAHVFSSSSSSTEEGGPYKMEWYWVVAAAAIFLFTGLTAGLLLRCSYGKGGGHRLLPPITFSNLLANETHHESASAVDDPVSSSRVDYIRQESSHTTSSFNYEDFGSVPRNTGQSIDPTSPVDPDADIGEVIRACNKIIRCASVEENHYSPGPVAECAREEVLYEELEVLQSMDSCYLDMSQNLAQETNP